MPPRKPPKFSPVKALQAQVDDLTNRVRELEDWESASKVGFEVIAMLTGVTDEFKEELRDRIRAPNGETE